MEYGYMALFAAGFGAATVLPGGSEVLFTAMLAGGFDACLCLLAASAGNWLGGMSTYALGCLGKIEWLEKYCKVGRKQIERVSRFLSGRGTVAAFFCFLPFVGDVIAFVLGMFRANPWLTALFMLAGKLFRYLLLLLGLRGLFGM